MHFYVLLVTIHPWDVDHYGEVGQPSYSRDKGSDRGYDLQVWGMRGKAGVYSSIVLCPQVCLVRVWNLMEN